MKLPKHADLWFPAYHSDRARNLIRRPPANQLRVAIADHYEPWEGRVSAQIGFTHGNSALNNFLPGIVWYSAFEIFEAINNHIQSAPGVIPDPGFVL